MSITETPMERAKRAKALLDERVRTSRLGKSMSRETDRDLIAMREASQALEALLWLQR